jgi:hypothetical protein
MIDSLTRVPFADLDQHGVAWTAGLWNSRRGDIVFSHGTLMLYVEHDADAVLRFHALVGLGHVYPALSVGGTRWPRARWGVSGFEPVQALIAAWWPWLSPTRRARARAVLHAAR